MATINQAHYGPGGMLLFQGELILLFCDGVTVSISSPNYKETGRLYLTTHRMVFTSKNTNSQFKSLSVPFMAMIKVDLEQPIFGANYIQVQARHADTNAPHLNFKLKFMHGGAIEYGQAMHNAVQMTARNNSMPAFSDSIPMPPPPAYTPSASQYYQAPPHVYQPAYNCGFPLPSQTFDQAPPVGFVYMSDAPPPYPGLGPTAAAPYPAAPAPGMGSAPAPGPGVGFNPSVYPGQPMAPGQQAPYPTGGSAPYPTQNPGYPPQTGGYQAPVYPGPSNGNAYPSVPNGNAPSYPGQEYPSAPPMDKK